MVFFKVSTNLVFDSVQAQQLNDSLAEFIAQQTNQPASFVMVELADAKKLMFAGSNAPAAYVECKSIGMNANQASIISAAVCKQLHTLMSISVDRIYIEFSHQPAELWGWNRVTFE